MDEQMSNGKILAIDIGGSKILTAIMDVFLDKKIYRGKLRGIQHCSLSKNSGKQEVLAVIERLIPPTLGEAGISWAEIDSIGVTIPGIADPKKGIWVYAPFSGITDFPIVAELQARYNRPVFSENDVNACAWAEKIFGVCQDIDDFLWVTISNGIGGGLVLNGRIYPGAFGAAAEIGHFNMVEQGELCGCGNRGCLEAEAAGPGIVRRFTKLIAATPLANQWNLVTISAYTIAEAARSENPIALEVYRQTGHLLGRAAAMATNLINPAKIVFGGGVSASFDLLKPQLEKTFREQVFQNVNKKMILEKTGLGYEAGLFGAAAITLSPS